MGVIIGIEGGGTKTGCAVLSEQGELLAYAEGGPANLNFVDEAIQRQSFETALEGVLQKVHEPIRVLGYAVAGTRANWNWLLERLGNPPTFAIEESRMAMLSTGVEVAHGVSVVAGTGSLVGGFKNDQLVKQMGGWGALLGDEGSAYDVAMRGIRAAVRAWDGRDRENRLIQAVQAFFGIQDLTELVPLFYQQGVPRHKVAEFAKSVVETARQGDPIAKMILARAGFDLSRDAQACAALLFTREDEFTVAMTGGMFKSKIFRTAFEEFFALIFPHAEFLTPVMEPAAAVAKAVWKKLDAGKTHGA
ncbi:MAG: ATPase [Fimbriimonadales bacterium]|nr:MAG: ATPase [Fimbriimonadales bacterium]